MRAPEDATAQALPAEREPPPYVGSRLADVILLQLLLLYGAVLVSTAWLADDAYITFRSIDNFVSGQGMRWNVAERVQTFTHPLWMLSLSGIYFFTREAYVTTLATSFLVSIAAFAVLAWYARRERLHLLPVAAALAILIVSKAFVDYSTSGLENPLSHLLLAVFVVLWFGAPESDTRLLRLSLLAGLATLNRMDTVLLFLPALTWELWRSPTSPRFTLVFLGFVPFVLWEGFATVYYGSPFPNTAYAKLNTGVSRLDAWELGFAYFANSLRRDPVTLLAITGGVLAGTLDRTRRAYPLAGGVLLYLLYVLHIGGDFMSGRFFAAPLLVAVGLLLVVGGRTSALRSLRLLPVALLAIALMAALPQRWGGSDGVGGQDLIDADGIADERAFYYPVSGLQNDTPIWMRPSGHAAHAGRRAHERGDPLIVSGAVGFQGYLAGPDTYVLDYHALGDPLLARLPMVKSDPFFRDFCIQFRGRPCSRPWRPGHPLRNVPQGYLESILSGENRLVDDHLRLLYDQIRLVTRGPIWSPARWRTIADLHFGKSSRAAGGWIPVEPEPTRFADAYERNPDTNSLSLLAGAAAEYQQTRRFEQAFECYRKAIALDPDDGVVMGKYGTALAQSGQLTQAIEWYRRALRAEPDLAGVHFNLGSALVQTGDIAEGITHLHAAIRIRPAYAEARTNLGVALMRVGQLPEAIDSFETAVQLRPEIAETRFSYAVALDEAGRGQEAIEQLHEALRLQPDYPRARQRLEAVRQRIPESGRLSGTD